MLARIIARIFRATERGATPDAAATQRDFAVLNAVAPLRPLGAPAPDRKPSGGEIGERSVIGREAVLDREQRVMAYEFALRQATRNRMQDRSRRIRHVYDEVVVRNILQFSVGRLLGHRLAFVSLLDSFLANPLVEQLPGSSVVLVVQSFDGETAPASAVERLATLKRAGFRIALGDELDGPAFAALSGAADYFLVGTQRRTPAQIKALSERLQREHPRAQRVARELASFDDFNLCRTLGFTAFQGPFVTSREDWTGGEVGPQSMRLFQLLNQLKQDVDTAAIAEHLRLDAVLSYRLLRYANSAAAGLAQPVSSIDHALLLLGRRSLYRWLTLLLFGSSPRCDHGEALLEHALVRARLMEQAACDRSTAQREDLFVVGLFSLLDRVFRMPLAEAIKPLHLAAPIVAALTEGTGPYAALLELAIACERGDEERIDAACAASGIDAGALDALHLDALNWAQDVMA